MAYAKHAGLADPTCQLYMLFYYIGPASVAFTLRRRRRTKSKEQFNNGSKNNDTSNGTNNNGTTFSYGSTNESVVVTSSGGGNNNKTNDTGYYDNDDKEDQERLWPSKSLSMKASGIAIFDLFAQSMVYTGNNLAGPTIFSIIYSSVTIWAALYSKLLLSRSLTKHQWFGVCLVVVGLSLTAVDSSTVGQSIFLGAILILVGSSFHGLTYVVSEQIMTPPSSPPPSTTTSASCIESDQVVVAVPAPQQHQQRRKRRQHISVRANCAVQGIVATLALLLWQVAYTLPRRSELVLAPMAEAGTTPLRALVILGSISLANVFHSVTFFVTLKYFPGGATSAGVLKGLQAVLVFACSSIVLCGRWGGVEMCWSKSKGVSLVVVVCGILTYGSFTEKDRRRKDIKKGEYKRVRDVATVSGGGEEGRIMCV